MSFEDLKEIITGSVFAKGVADLQVVESVAKLVKCERFGVGRVEIGGHFGLFRGSLLFFENSKI